MSTNLHTCGSHPVLPSTTPHPRPQAYNNSKINGISAPNSITSAPRSLRFASLDEGHVSRALQRENSKLRKEASITDDRVNTLKRANEELRVQVHELSKEAATKDKLISNIQGCATRNKVRSDRLIEALAALSIDEQSKDKQVRSRVEDQLRPYDVKRRAKLDWGGSNDAMFKKALTVIARERNEMQIRAEKAEQELKALRASHAALETKMQESNYARKYSKRPSVNGWRDQGAEGHRLSRNLKRTPSLINGLKSVDSKNSDLEQMSEEDEQDKLSEFSGREGRATVDFLNNFIEDLSLPPAPATWDDDDPEKIRKSKLTLPQTEKVFTLLELFQTCVLNTFRLNDQHKGRIGQTVALFNGVEAICQKLAKGAKHITLWIIDNENQMWTRSHRQGRMVKFRYDDKRAGIAGHVARTGECVVINNRKLYELEDYEYDPKVDHLGSSQEFMDPKNMKQERQGACSLVTIPIFQNCYDTETALVEEEQEILPKAILQISKNASKSASIHRRVFSQAEVFVLSMLGHNALWMVQNDIVANNLQTRDAAMRAFLEFPKLVLKSMTIPFNARRTEQAKIELLDVMEKQILSTFSKAKRCRIFALGEIRSKPSLFWAPKKKGFEIDAATGEEDEDLDNQFRSSCQTNSGIAGYCAEHCETLFLETPYNDGRYNWNIDIEAQGLTLISTPIFELKTANTKRLLGVLQVGLPANGQSRAHLLQVVTNELATQIGVTIGLSQIKPGSY